MASIEQINPSSSNPEPIGVSFKFTRKSWRIICYVALLSQVVQGQAPELGLGWVPEFNLAARQLVALAESIPPEKFSWRPGAGVRSTSELFMHVAVGNYYLLADKGRGGLVACKN